MSRTLFVLVILSVLGLQAVDLPVVVRKQGPVRAENVPLSGLSPQHQYSLLYSISSLKSLTPKSRVVVEVRQGGELLAAKTLHSGDPDFYTQFRVRSAGAAELAISATEAGGNYTLQVNRWPLADTIAVASDTPERAMPILLGSTVFGSGDDSPYVPVEGTPRRALPGKQHWYQFQFTSATPKLLYVGVDLVDRDQIPANVQVFRKVGGKLEEYFDGEDPVTLPHEVQALPGNKFTPRLLKEQGTYLIAVRASHPEYKLRTRTYDPPPYSDPRQAVKTALDYVLSSGDSWHANTPRRGGVLDRVASVHQETSLCVACHATHFPQRAQLYATRNGYPVANRSALQFLSERFYNNPRPFYGFEEQGAVWSRMISAPANVLGRMSHLMSIFEEQVSAAPRPSFHKGVAEYLKLYYADRDKLPGDETNGNTPLVSTHEVGWYAWSVTKDPRIPEMIAAAEVKNNIDLCYQTLALAEMDRERFRPILEKNVDRLLKLQRPDGQWSMRFEPAQPAVEFQTGHALWALHAAGVPATHPQVARAIEFLLKRQQVFGGWLDPLQSFENFRTPFRETQMAILALSAYFPLQGRTTGWNAPAAPTKLAANPVELLEQLDNFWDRPSAALIAQVVSAAKSNDALVRQAAVEALGRLGELPDARLLGDESKLVQRTAAWATRLAHSRNEALPVEPLLASLGSGHDRTRWGATRVFSAHFASLARRPEVAAALQKLVSESVPAIRTGAVKALWQLWFWTPDVRVKDGVEDTLLAALGKEQHPGVALNLRHAIHNLADENIRYLYNNWVPLLARGEDRETSIKGRLAIEDRLAGKFARILEDGSAAQKKELLTALTELPLRRGDVYDLEADLNKTAPPVYNRIGNDIEQITFFGQSAERFARALKPLLDSDDREMKRLAAQGVLLLRETRFGDVNRLAGPKGESVKVAMAQVETMPEGAEVARALKPPPVNVAAAGSSPATTRPKVKLDEAYFRGYVQPILEKRGKDGYACVHCHASHTLFSGSYSTALNVVDPSQPEKSLLLMKPTSTAESEGVAGSSAVSHGGGVRWPKDSPEYVTILEWIKGAKE